MKKKYVRAAALTAALIMSVCACNGPAPAAGSPQTPEETAADSTDASENAQDGAPDSAASSDDGGASAVDTAASQTGTGSEEAGQPEDGKQGEGEYVLYSESRGGAAYIVDSEGNKLAEYDLESILKGLPGKAADYSIKAVGDGLIYLSTYVNEDDTSVFRVYAVDPVRMENAVVWTANSEQSQESVDLYDGKLHITFNTNDDIKCETIFTRVPGKLVFDSEAGTLDDFFEASRSYTLYGTAPEPMNSYDRCCYERLFDTYGHVLGRDYDDNKWVLFKRDGSATEINSLAGKNAYVEGYDNAYLYYQPFDDDYNATGSYVLDLDTFGERKTDIDVYDTSFLACRDNYLYYSLNKSEEYYHADNHIFRYSPKDDLAGELYSVQTVPGASSIEAGKQDFRLAGSYIYYTGVSGDEVHWYAVDADGGTPADTGFKVCDINALKYGRIDYRSETDKCRFCGTELSKTYSETLELDPSWSDHADKISAYLRKIMNDGFSDSEEEYPATDEDCDEHREYPMQWCTTVEHCISDVSVISDRYLAVDYSGYWYGGGAHGYPERGQYVFDLKTGERLELGDLYSGSNEDFKKFVAEKTKEDFRRQQREEGEYTQYFAEDEEEAYNSAYENADLKTTYVEFGPDGAAIVYQPYEMGSYAAGYIEIPVSYKELFGRDKL